jgi:hypothetical protein
MNNSLGVELQIKDYNQDNKIKIMVKIVKLLKNH